MRHLLICLFVFSVCACGEGESGLESPSHSEPGGEQGEAAKVAGQKPSAESTPKTEVAPKAAIFVVGEELAPPKIQALGTSLAGLDGVLAAKPDTTAGTFVVTFTPDKVTPEAIGERLAGAAAGVEFMGLTTPTEIPANHDDCGKCPYKDECDGAH